MIQNTFLKKQLSLASGPIDFTLTNDYMFRACLQDNLLFLKALVASLLHLDISQILDIVILNPITLGDAIDNKTFILDMRLLLNSNRYVNLEMQVSNQYNWPERSTCYAARSYQDQLSPGEEYREILPVINIGFLDFTLFPDAPEFYSRNLLMNMKNHKIYSDKFDIRVLDLTCIHLATEEDKTYHINGWARLFKATTWEDLRMIAEKNTYLGEAGRTLYKMNADEMIREQCFARALYEYDQAKQRRIHENDKREIAERDAIIATQASELAHKDAELAHKDAELAHKDAEISALKARLQTRQ